MRPGHSGGRYLVWIVSILLMAYCLSAPGGEQEREVRSAAATDILAGTVPDAMPEPPGKPAAASGSPMLVSDATGPRAQNRVPVTPVSFSVTTCKSPRWLMQPLRYPSSGDDPPAAS